MCWLVFAASRGGTCWHRTSMVGITSRATATGIEARLATASSFAPLPASAAARSSRPAWSRMGKLVEGGDGAQQAAHESGVVIHQVSDSTKEAAQPFGERPKSREETPKKGMRPKAWISYARSATVVTLGDAHGCVPPEHRLGRFTTRWGDLLAV